MRTVGEDYGYVRVYCQESEIASYGITHTLINDLMYAIGSFNFVLVYLKCPTPFLFDTCWLQMVDVPFLAAPGNIKVEVAVNTSGRITSGVNAGTASQAVVSHSA